MSTKFHINEVKLNVNVTYSKHISIGLQSKKEGKARESIQSSTTPDPGYQWESDNVTIRHHKREPRGQPFPSRCPQGINKQTCMVIFFDGRYLYLAQWFWTAAMTFD